MRRTLGGWRHVNVVVPALCYVLIGAFGTAGALDITPCGVPVEVGTLRKETVSTFASTTPLISQTKPAPKVCRRIGGWSAVGGAPGGEVKLSWMFVMNCGAIVL